MYVAVKGGERAIDNAHAWLAEERRGDVSVAELSVAQIREQLALAVNRVMAEGSLYDPDLAALAIKQSRGDLIEAIFLIRAYRTTLPRFGCSEPVETGRMACDRRVSATFKDAPGGQVLGPTFDYTHRLLDFALEAEGLVPEAAQGEPRAAETPHVTEFLNAEGLIQEENVPEDDRPRDLTREPLELPAGRPLRLQALTRGDEGFVLGMAYSTQRGYGRNHPFVGELRIGTVPVEMEVPELGFAVEIGEVVLTECETVNQFTGSKSEPPQFTRGYGLDAGIIAHGGDGNPAFNTLYGMLKQAPDTHKMGRIVIVGGARIDSGFAASRGNIDVRSAARTGAGYHDEAWEHGADYPPVFVQWTTTRNLEECLILLDNGGLRVEPLITHRSSLDDALAACEDLIQRPNESLGVVIHP